MYTCCMPFRAKYPERSSIDHLLLPVNDMLICKGLVNDVVNENSSVVKSKAGGKGAQKWGIIYLYQGLKKPSPLPKDPRRWSMMCFEMTEGYISILGITNLALEGHLVYTMSAWQ